MNNGFKIISTLRIYGSAALFLVMSVLQGNSVFAQTARILTLEHPVYPMLERLQQRGFLDGLSPNRLPWRHHEVLDALNALDDAEMTQTERFWLQQAKKGLETETEKAEISATFQGGGFLSNYDRNEPLRSHRTSAGAMPNGVLQARFSEGSWAVQAGLGFDRYYDQDPDGLDLARRLYMRSEGSYLAWNSAFVQISLGRFRQSWTGFSLPGAVLSQNPAAFDHVSFSAGNDTWRVTSLLGELDLLGGDGTFSQRDRFVDGTRRYLALHRLDWRPRKNMQFSIFEGVLYSSKSAGISLAYLNPAQVLFLESDNDPKNFENNLTFGFLSWMRFQKVTFHGQLLLDDGVYENRQVLKQSGQLEPSSYSSVLNITWADALPDLDVSVTGHRVSNLAYRTDQMEGQWSYAQRGLAANFSDFIDRKVQFSWHAFSIANGLTLGGYLQQLQQGEGDFRLPLANDANDAGNPAAILAGVVEKTGRLAGTVIFQPAAGLLLTVDAGVNRVQNRFHIPENEELIFSWLARISWRIN